MSKKLNTHDAQAIDLLLDQSEQVRGMSAASFSQPSEQVFRSVGPAQKVLSLLDVWQPEEPAADLVRRTLARVSGTSLESTDRPEKGVNSYGPLA